MTFSSQKKVQLKKNTYKMSKKLNLYVNFSEKKDFLEVISQKLQKKSYNLTISSQSAD